MNEDEFTFFLIWTIIIILLTGICSVHYIASDFEDFTKEHIKTPYCIEREIGHEKIKKCYIAVEVKDE